MAKIYTRVHRLLRLVNAIQSKRGMKVADLARLCEMHERSIYRDIDTLNASGVPCTFDPESEGYRLAAGFFMPPIEVTFEEAMAVVALLEEVGDGTQIPFLGMASRVGEKLRAQLSPAVLEAIEPVDDCVKIDLARGQADDSCRDVYDDVRDAISSRRILRCTYEPAKGRSIGDTANTEEFDLRPYALWYCQRAWYVVGHHSGRGEVRRLKLNRFAAIRKTDRPFAIPDDFDLRGDLGNAWRMIRGDKRYEVAVRFDAAFSDTASETRWHPTQVEEYDAETGAVTLRFSVDGLDEIVWWVLGYGPGAVVLEPVELIERVKELARATVKRYAGKKS
ncbi:MAG TPA: WYL domain-containing protein [Tepidisphaeraceae bacterium]|nr:WYL domain-containing protein [Tepidisphaeraceae bacterium]